MEATNAPLRPNALYGEGERRACPLAVRTWTHLPGSLDSQLVSELRTSKSWHGEVVVEGSGTTDPPVANEGVSGEVGVCGVLATSGRLV